MTLRGKGFFIWKVASCEGGDAQAIAATAYEAGLSHVLIKIADNTRPYNYDMERQIDVARPVVEALHAKGIQAWGWHYVYGVDPAHEASVGAQRVSSLGLDGYVIDAEAEFEAEGKAAAAQVYMDELRKGLPDTPLALSSFRFPSYHPRFPWSVFLEKCDLNMPQVYWHGAHNAGAQLDRCYREFQGVSPFRPMIPTGAAYKARTWEPSEDDLADFLNTARNLKFDAVNFYSWDDCRVNEINLWNLNCQFPWPNSPVLQDIVDRYISALNSRDVERVLALYHTNSVHITGERTIQGLESLREWYTMLFNQTLPDGEFNLTGMIDSANNRQFTWTARSNLCSVRDGRDTMGLLGGKIMYHYTYFTLSPP